MLMTDRVAGKYQFGQPAGSSRRQVVLTLAALAASSQSGRVWAQGAGNWPLWTVQGENGKAYLTGETPPRPVAWKDGRIERLLPSCSALWTETNQVQRQDTQALIKRYGIDNSRPLLSKLTEIDQGRLAKAAELAKLPLDSLTQTRPWLAAFTLEQAYYGNMNLQESGTTEKVLMPRAKDVGIPVSSEFPTIDDLVTFMGESLQAEDVQYLQYTLDHILDGPAANERIYSLWARGDISGAEEMVRRMKSSQPAMYKKHVIGRNRDWVPRIDEMLKSQKPALIIVGLYHLVGPDSILVRLGEHGLKVAAA